MRTALHTFVGAHPALLGQTTCAGAGADCTLPAGHTFGLPGTYYVTTNAGDATGNWCTGNYNGGLDLWGGALPPNAQDCGPSDRLTVTVAPAPLTPPPTNHTWRLYYHAGGQRVAMRVLTGTLNTLYYLHGDHLGSTSKVTCGNAACGALGSVAAAQYYYPFGAARHVTGTLPTDYGFTGQRLDADIGLHFYNARSYDARTGRFASADSIVPGAGNPQALNRYSYVLNAPTRYTDPTGHYCYDSTGGAHAGTCMDGSTSNRPRRPAPDRRLAAIHTASLFGVTFEGPWATTDLVSAASSLVTVGHALVGAFGADRSPFDLFREVIGDLIFRRVTFSCAEACWGRYPSQTPSGRREIWFYPEGHGKLDPRFITHELGHAFNASIINKTGVNPYTALNGEWSDPRFPRRGIEDHGFAGGLWSWQWSDQPTPGEEFADMFVGWAYNAWRSESPGNLTPGGQARSDWMTVNMSHWIRSVLGPPGAQ